MIFVDKIHFLCSVELVNKTFSFASYLNEIGLSYKQSYELICDRGCPEFLMYFLYF